MQCPPAHEIKLPFVVFHFDSATVVDYSGQQPSLIQEILAMQLRQCEVLKREDDEGKELTPEERRKLGMMAEWQQELDNLESLIS